MPAAPGTAALCHHVIAGKDPKRTGHDQKDPEFIVIGNIKSWLLARFIPGDNRDLFTDSASKVLKR
jgi:hypothetical protein